LNLVRCAHKWIDGIRKREKERTGKKREKEGTGKKY